ncbi:RDD family protein [Longivirga aurantiaca]|uniref:RDD family protein n=1 Tax=Longivirga aurantiaca TaxID=1837743 RepID=A0ABW1T3K8_9ACTN
MAGEQNAPDGEQQSRGLTRRDLGSWLSGPGSVLPPTQDYPGQRLGLPDDGPGSIARWGRRIGALFLDWFACVLLVRLLFSGLAYGTPESSFATMGVFLVQLTLLTWATGSSFGQRVFGIGVLRLDGMPPGFGRAFLRSLQVCLLVPAVIWDRDMRGLHDRSLGLVLVRR